MNTDSSDELTQSEATVATDHSNHPDPITGEAGAHPLGVGIGAMGGGLAAAAIGAIAGPIGALVGAAVGAFAGGLAGKEVASTDDEAVSPVEQSPETFAAEEVSPAHASLQAEPTGAAELGAFLPGVEEPLPGQFHEAFTTTTWQEVADEERVSEGNPSDETAVREAAYFRYLQRAAAGEHGDELGDWVRAEGKVAAQR